MRSHLKSLLAGAALLSGAASLSPALAGDNHLHVMTVRLPDGSLAQVQYIGDVPPQIEVVPARHVPVGFPAFVAPPSFGPPFAMIERMSAMLDRQAEMMMRQAAAMQATMVGDGTAFPDRGRDATMASAPLGSGVCIRSMQITFNGLSKPQVVSHTSGDSGPAANGAMPTQMNAPTGPVAPAAGTPRTIEVKANTDRAVLAMAQQTQDPAP